MLIKSGIYNYVELPNDMDIGYWTATLSIDGIVSNVSEPFLIIEESITIPPSNPKSMLGIQITTGIIIFIIIIFGIGYYVKRSFDEDSQDYSHENNEKYFKREEKKEILSKGIESSNNQEKSIIIQDKELEITEKLKNILNVSNKVRIDAVRNALRMNIIDFNVKLFEWAKEFGFKIDGDFIVIEDADINGFISNLDKQFELWGSQSKEVNRK